MLLFHSLTYSRKLWVCNTPRNGRLSTHIFLNERMETFVCKADTVRKRLQIRSSRKRHSGRDLRGSFKETENQQVKHLFQAGYKQKGDNGSCHPFCLKRVTFPRLRSQTNLASFCRGVRQEPTDQIPRWAKRCCEFSGPAPWCGRIVSSKRFPRRCICLGNPRE